MVLPSPIGRICTESCGNYGWSEEDAQTFHEMTLRYAVLLEERRGPTTCVIIVYNLLHFKDDITRLNGLDKGESSEEIR